jgi:hypothetical protein
VRRRKGARTPGDETTRQTRVKVAIVANVNENAREEQLRRVVDRSANEKKEPISTYDPAFTFNIISLSYTNYFLISFYDYDIYVKEMSTFSWKMSTGHSN